MSYSFSFLIFIYCVCVSDNMRNCREKKCCMCNLVLDYFRVELILLSFNEVIYFKKKSRIYLILFQIYHEFNQLHLGVDEIKTQARMDVFLKCCQEIVNIEDKGECVSSFFFLFCHLEPNLCFHTVFVLL